MLIECVSLNGKGLPNRHFLSCGLVKDIKAMRNPSQDLILRQALWKVDVNGSKSVFFSAICFIFQRQVKRFMAAIENIA